MSASQSSQNQGPETRSPSRFAVLLLPAIISQSMIIGGGYSTGREITQYAGRFGPSGWLAVLIIFLGFSITAALVFELARVGNAYDYKSWVKLLIGPLWPLFDLINIAMLLLVISVMSAAIGSVLLQTIGLPYGVGLLIAFVFVGFLAWKGTRVMERFKTIGSGALYIAYIAFAVIVLLSVEASPPPADAPLPPATGVVVLSAVQYVGYNLATFPPVLFCLYRQRTRSETTTSGMISGAMMTIPFALTFLCLMRFWPSSEVLDAEVPWLPMLASASDRFGGSALWFSIFGVVAGWTLLETAVGGIHALVDRLEHNLDDLPRGWRPQTGHFSPMQRAAISIGVLGLATGLARFGIIDLVAKGYGALSWGFLLLMLLPLLTVGVYRILSYQEP